MSTGGNLRVFVVLLVVQVCLLALLATPCTVHARSATAMFPANCPCPRFAECCRAAATGRHGQLATKSNP
ncbi:Os01g0800101 [Oryza sativa Japonica Group]|uniref:Os01g0800101 protein n=2 Tax=Oryza sativa subsp. japonica TaxID=39947 RepID=B9ETR4_ORYSJ|nr:hypothetical protein OsJ_03765 [Oryza sativa Japonica Group]KAB8083902.1 hypothetical protein EE612_006297 [Oryza sativa]KAF2952819.1 hypothetical protein DAI22_01g365100 [Oryza sativa Japonica Group]BAS74787.1 Os01g0800101 [Oryza sativa Japonica Group]